MRRAVGLTRGRNSGQVLVTVIDDSVTLTPRRAKVVGDFLGDAVLPTESAAIISIGDEEATAPRTPFIESHVILRAVFDVHFAEMLAEAEAATGNAFTVDQANAFRATVATDAAVA